MMFFASSSPGVQQDDLAHRLVRTEIADAAA